MSKKNERMTLRMREELKASIERVADLSQATLTTVVEVAVRDLLRHGEDVAALRCRSERHPDMP